ncbi:putative glycosyl hydrolase 47 family protein [Lyophyllum shimeji]|uniref:Multifunctional fusion protein n=1 Tax=Lyophyllum shimeji TaxID=47721 RepID=A0A9P3PTR8_LYOSH|nr:putative glycosyl hydrolase 47 family protein [Lyophyllum shimeji]
MSTDDAPTKPPPPSSNGKMPPGMVMGLDGKPCKICTAFRNWRPRTGSNTEAREKGQMSGGQRSTAAMMAALASGTAQSPAQAASAARADEPPPNCPPDVEQLGRATWTFLHTTAAYYPEKPTSTQRANMLMLLRALPVLYPCTNCAEDFGDDMKHNPPDVALIHDAANARTPATGASAHIRGSRIRRAPKIHSFVGRPLLRWLSWAFVSVLILWVAGPFVVNFFRPPPYAYIPPPDRGEHHRPHPHHPPPPWLRPPPTPPNKQHPEIQPTVWASRAGKVKDAFVHAYQGYRKHALPYDELLPVTGKKVNNFNGWGVTLFDSLDTMWIMGLNDMFNDALEVVAHSTFVTKSGDFAPFFETVIRYLGGLLSAYALSGEPILLSRADDLGAVLLPAFNTTSGFPMYAVNTVTGQTSPGWSVSVLWAEALSNQMEFKYLAHLTGRQEYYDKTERVMHHMYDGNIPGDIFPTMWNYETGLPANDHFSVGAYADSAHEYLLKQWLLTGQSEPKTRDLYLRSMQAVINNLLYLTPTRHLLYVTDTQKGTPTHTFEHLSCFLPGLLALGVHTLDLPRKEKELHAWAAEGLAQTCWLTYADMPTGLGADEVVMNVTAWNAEDADGDAGGKGRWVKHVKEWERKGRPGGVPPGVGEVKPVMERDEREYSLQKRGYLLRPETIESFYVLWRTTGDEKWRERGWSIFEAIEKLARTKYGYANINNVDGVPVTLTDEMPSYFLAETLKYLYLLFTDDDIIPLNDWVFNTEAHPLPAFNWRKWEKERYGIPS